MATKIIELSEFFNTGERTLQPALLWANGKPFRGGFTKTASPALDYIKHNVEPIPGKSIVLVISLGGWETYGLNRNGDGFNECEYRAQDTPACGCDSCKGNVGWVQEDQSVVNHNKSFEDFAKVYKHHVNKDPNRSYGDVLKAFWNPKMHRSELLLGIDNAKAPDLAERIEAGEFFPVSMGCRIKYDVCTYCGHRAPTRAQYCDHLKYQMRQVMPNGIIAGALNPSPKFFDISVVYKPADRTGYMIKKVAEETAPLYTGAELGELVIKQATQKTALRKMSDINKVVKGVALDANKALEMSEEELVKKLSQTVAPVVDSEELLSDDALAKLAPYHVGDTLKALADLGIIVTTPELVRLFAAKLAPDYPVSDEMVQHALNAQDAIFELLAEHPEACDSVEPLLRGPGHLGAEDVKQLIGDEWEKRSAVEDYLTRKFIPQDLRREELPRTDVVTVQDPRTGATYKTTRGAVIKEHDRYAKRNVLRKLLLPDFLFPKYTQEYWGPITFDTSGRPLPAGTEMYKASAARDNKVGIVLALMKNAAMATNPVEYVDIRPAVKTAFLQPDNGFMVPPVDLEAILTEVATHMVG